MTTDALWRRNNGGIMCWSMFWKFYFIKGHRRHRHVCHLSFENSLNSCSVLNAESYTSEAFVRNKRQRFSGFRISYDELSSLSSFVIVKTQQCKALQSFVSGKRVKTENFRWCIELLILEQRTQRITFIVNCPTTPRNSFAYVTKVIFLALLLLF